MTIKNRVTRFDELADVQVTATEPTARLNGDPLEDNDLWLDLSVAPPVWMIYDLSGTSYVAMGGGGGGTWLDPAASGNAPGGADDDEFADDSIAVAWTAQTVTGTATWAEDGDVLACVFNSQTAGDLAAQLRAISGTPAAPTAITTAVRLLARNEDGPRVGLVFTDGTAAGSNAVFAFLEVNAVGGQMELRHRAGTLTAINTSEALGSPASVPLKGLMMPWLHIRLTWVSSNSFRAEWSPTGTSGSWIRMGMSDLGKTMTPTHYGVAVSTNGGASQAVGTFEFFRAS